MEINVIIASKQSHEDAEMKQKASECFISAKQAHKNEAIIPVKGKNRFKSG
ncbi:MAG: hypothetical protein ACO1OC_12255 [Tuberibacillus sp.]